jgi:hypothetical protein
MTSPLNKMMEGISRMIAPIVGMAGLIAILVKSSAMFGSVFKGLCF